MNIVFQEYVFACNFIRNRSRDLSKKSSRGFLRVSQGIIRDFFPTLVSKLHRGHVLVIPAEIPTETSSEFSEGIPTKRFSITSDKNSSKTFTRHSHDKCFGIIFRRFYMDYLRLFPGYPSEFIARITPNVPQDIFSKTPSSEISEFFF